LNVAAGYYNVLAIKTDGTLWAWGINNLGQLGQGNITSYSSPKQVGALTNWARINNNMGRNSMAIKTDGTLWVWGYNALGGLGLGNTTSYSSPKQVGSLNTWSNVSAGRYFTLANF
jgi:alpha-tubulin suppressor-like RCC1 family protein